MKNDLIAQGALMPVCDFCEDDFVQRNDEMCANCRRMFEESCVGLETEAFAREVMDALAMQGNSVMPMHASPLIGTRQAEFTATLDYVTYRVTITRES